MEEEKRSRRDAAHDIIGAEIEHALGGLCRKRFDRVACKIAAQVQRYRHDVVARDHQRLPCTRAVLAPIFQHLGEARPLLWTLMLAAELALPVTPTTIRDDSGEAIIDSGGIDGNRTAEARADHPDALGIDACLPRQEGQCIAGILDLLQTD